MSVTDSTAEVAEVAEVAEAAKVAALVAAPVAAPVTVEVAAPGHSKLYWGPRIWGMFHSLAEISDRRDVLGLWRAVLATTAAAMPCAQCRQHFSQYLYLHSPTYVKRTVMMTGPQIKTKMRTELWKLHNIVSQTTGKEAVPITILDELGTKTRHELLLEAQKLMNEIIAVWTPMVHSAVKAPAFLEWKRALNLLITVLRSGPC